MKRFGEIVKATRRNLGLTLESTAKKIGTSKGYISGIESGAVQPPSEKFTLKLASLLQLDEQELLAISVIEKRPKSLKIDSLRQILTDW